MPTYISMNVPSSGSVKPTALTICFNLTKVWDLSSRFEPSQFALAQGVARSRNSRYVEFIVNIQDTMMRRNTKVRIICVVTALLLVESASSDFATATTSKVPESSKIMHGIKLSDYGDFEKKWKLVTVRFRKDTSELRFTYANESAWRHLQKISQKNAPSSSNENPIAAESYPLGAVFAKVGIKTAEDPAFLSSAVPSGVRRVQFMVRDENKFAETDGWGYALFDSKGSTFPGDLKQASMACAACHKIVPDRGYVFSQFMTGFAPTKPALPEGGRVKFENLQTKDLPEFIQLQLPPKSVTVRSVTGPIAEQVFPGTLDEIRPALTREVIRSGDPAILLSKKKGEILYSIVYSTNSKGSCGPDQKEFLGVMNVTEKAETVQSIRFCESEKK